MRVGLVLVVVGGVACSHSPKPVSTTTTTPPRPQRMRLAILPAESNAFPHVAQAATESLEQAQIAGLDAQISKVSLEIVQLSIECVDASMACYVAAGKSLAANRLLFAELGGTKKALSVTVKQIDVDASITTKTATKTFANERAAAEGVAALVGEVTSP